MTNLGTTKQYLEAEFFYHPIGIWVQQKVYINRVLQKFETTTCKGTSLSMDHGCLLQRQMDTSLINLELYRSLVGSLIYIINTRLNIYHAISIVNWFVDHFEEAHIQAVHQILQYLKQIKDFGLHFL
jgi:hypothetical protein